MKFFVVFACLLAIAVAAPGGGGDHDAHVLKQDQDVEVDSFHYAIETDNHIKANQEGHLEEHDNWVVKGSYEFADPHGQVIHVDYTADDHGYHPKVDQSHH